MRVFTAVLLFSALAFPQSPPPRGAAPDWDIRVILQELSAHASRLLPLLDKADVKAWVANGASETYAAQLQSTKDQVRAVAAGAKELAAKPEKLSAALELYFRLQAIDSMVRSIENGIRKYQDPAAADALAAVARESGPNRERFQRYITEMAVQREQEYAVMDHEAQRCRGMLAREPVNPRNSGRKK